MGSRFGTAEWARSLTDEINASSEYRNAGAKWGVGFNGTLLFAFEADGALAAPLYLLVPVAGGRCSGCRWVEGPGHSDAGFTLRAPFTLWREILERRALAATAILTGRMKVQGDSLRLLQFAGAHRSLVHCAASVSTGFPA